MQLSRLFKKFDELLTAELYAIMRLRNEVFVVEQNCIYQDAVDKDQRSRHLTGWDGEDLVAYTRIIPPGISYDMASIGRVVTSSKHRNTGVGRKLMEESISKPFNEFNCTAIKIGTQVYLVKFYQSPGFLQSSTAYPEDGIPHIEMTLSR